MCPPVLKAHRRRKRQQSASLSYCCVLVLYCRISKCVSVSGGVIVLYLYLLDLSPASSHPSHTPTAPDAARPQRKCVNT